MRYARWIAVASATAAVFAMSQGAASADSTVKPTTPVKSGVTSYQLGIDLDFYMHKKIAIRRNISADAAYARDLGANSVMISFPFYVKDGKPARGEQTPTPADLADAIIAARDQGVTVGVRPLLDEFDQPTARTSFQPAHVGRWLKTYKELIVPYAAAAQKAGADRFWVGAELTKFAHNAEWYAVDKAIAAVFKGKLYFSANWVTTDDVKALPGSGGPGARASADAYPLMPVALDKLAAQWKDQAKALPRGTVLSEVGIAARKGAQGQPYNWRPSHDPVDSAVQAAWFAAACDAVPADHLGGIYFWRLSVGRPLKLAPTPATDTQFTASAGAKAIKACFKRLK